MHSSSPQIDSRKPPRDQSASCDLQSTIAYRPWLHRFAIMLVIATFALLALGGTVTSKGAGLAVPDWPTTYEHNMFLFPVSLWVGGVFWEHTHRLLASLVGFMTIIMAAWLWVSQKPRPWLKRCGVIMLILVCVQGVMGGLRVTKDPSHPNLAMTLATIHGITAQLFLCGAVLTAAATGRFWLNHSAKTSGGINKLCSALLIILLIQLTLGAAMRHTGSGLAIPDFPSAYGQLLPPFTSEGIESAADQVLHEDAYFEVYPSPMQVGVHFAHRVWAVVVVVMTMVVLARISPLYERHPSVQRIAIGIVAFILIQIALGASVIWTGKHPEVATTHQMIGAVLMAMVTWLTVRVSLVGPAKPQAAKGCDSLIALPTPGGMSV